MARNRIDMSLDRIIGKQGKYKAKQGQTGKSALNGPRGFKLKRKSQQFVNIPSMRRNNIGGRNSRPSGLKENGVVHLAARKQEWKNKTKQFNLASGNKGNKNFSRNDIKINTSRGANKKGPTLVERSKVGSKKINATNFKKEDKPKLFTKGFDARKRIEAKRLAKERGSVAPVRNSSKVQLDASRQEQKDAELNQRRALSMIGGKMQVVSRIKDEEERKALFTGSSLKITALQTSTERHQNREAMIQGNNALLITTTNNEDLVKPNNSRELSEYSLFEARRKAEAERMAATEIPKLPSLHPISRPRRQQSPVYRAEEENVAVDSSRVLVTNLHPNVSPDDIFELFGAVAPVKSSSLLRSGVAEVIYETSDDALTAYRKYNGRNLDGQPMICKVAFPDQQIYQTPSSTRFHQPETKHAQSAKSSARPVVFTVKI